VKARKNALPAILLVCALHAAGDDRLVVPGPPGRRGGQLVSAQRSEPKTLNWVLAMFLVSMVFIFFKRNSGSLLGAIICHAAFNLGMIYCIFYLL